jgi:hypothetical protein
MARQNGMMNSKTGVFVKPIRKRVQPTDISDSSGLNRTRATPDVYDQPLKFTLCARLAMAQDYTAPRNSTLGSNTSKSVSNLYIYGWFAYGV